MAEEFDLLDLLSNGEKGKITTQQYLALSLLPIAIDKVENDIWVDIDDSLEMLKDSKFLKDEFPFDRNDVMKTLKTFMKSAHLSFPLCSSDILVSSSYSYKDEKQKHIRLKNLSVASYYIHDKVKPKHIKNFPVERKLKVMLIDFNQSFQLPEGNGKLLENWADGVYYFAKEKKTINFVTSAVNKIEKRVDDNNKAVIEKDKKDLRTIIAYAVLSKYKNTADFAEFLFKYSSLFKDALVYTGKTDLPRQLIDEIRNNPEDQIIPYLKEFIDSIKKENPFNSLTFNRDNYNYEPKFSVSVVTEFFDNVSKGFLMDFASKHSEMTLKDIKSIRPFLENCNILFSKLDLPLAEDGDIDYVISNRTKNFNDNVYLANKRKNKNKIL